MSYLKKLQEEAKEKLPWLPRYFTVTDIQDEYVSGWIRSDIEWEFLRHIHEKETGVHFMMRHDDRARKAKQQQRYYIKHEPIPINKHPFKLYRLITFACEHKDLGPSRRRIPDHLRKKKTKMTMVDKVDCPAKITVRKVTIYDGFVLPPKASSKMKMKVVKDLKSQLEKSPDLVPKSNWIFVTLPLEAAHRNHAILKYESVGVKPDKKSKFENEEDNSDNESAVSLDEDVFHNASGDDGFRQMSRSQVPSSSDYNIVTTQHMHLPNTENQTDNTYSIMPHCTKQNQVIIHNHEHEFKSPQTDLSWMRYDNEVNAAVASVVSHETDTGVVESQFDPSDHVATVTVVTDVPVENIDNQQDIKITSVSVKTIKDHHDQTPKSIQTPRSHRGHLTPKRQANMLATEKRVYTNLCIMNITSTIEILKKFKDLVPSCVDENIVETIAGMRKKLGEMYEKYKYNKVSPNIKEENKMQNTYIKMSEPVGKKRKSVKYRSSDSFTEDIRIHKKRKSEMQESEVHTLMPAIIHHHDPTPITLERHNPPILPSMHQDPHHQDVQHMQHVTSVSSSSTPIPLSLPTPAPAHQNYQVHQNFHSNSMMNVWIHQ